MYGRRLASTEARKDFVSLLAQKVRKGEVEKEEMTAHVSTFTYAVFLSYLPCQLEWIDTQSLRPFCPSFGAGKLTNLSRIAGGETVSTFLAGTTCFLLQHPEKMKLLVSEIRGTFQSYEDIKAQSAQQLPYLQAVINEGLRLFPPGSQGSPRVSPGFELHGKYIPEGVRHWLSYK